MNNIFRSEFKKYFQRILRPIIYFGTCSFHKHCIKSPDYGGPQLSHQNKMLTSNSNHSQQIQIAHSKFKLLTANSNCSQQITNRSYQIQIVHIKYKSLTANRSQQIQIPHSNCTKTVSAKGRLQTVDCGLRTADCGLRNRGKSRPRVKCRLQTKGKIQNEDRRLGVKCRMKTADCRPGGK